MWEFGVSKLLRNKTSHPIGYIYVWYLCFVELESLESFSIVQGYFSRYDTYKSVVPVSCQYVDNVYSRSTSFSVSMHYNYHL